MKKSLLFAALLVAALTSCQRGSGDVPAQPAPDSAQAATDASTGPEAPAAEAVSAVEKVEASGKTGIWSEPAGVCAKGDKAGVLVAWNARASGAEKVRIDMLTPQGTEKTFAKGGPVGAKQAGRWVRPGHVFKLRNEATGEDLGTVTIEDRGC